MIRSESGSILPIGIGLLALTAALSMFFLEQIGIQLQTLQNKQVADVLSLKIATDLNRDGIAPIEGLDYRPPASVLLSQATEFLKLQPTGVSITSHDGKTIDTTICTRWRSITGLTLGVFGEVCANSKARAVS